MFKGRRNPKYVIECKSFFVHFSNVFQKTIGFDGINTHSLEIDIILITSGDE